MCWCRCWVHHNKILSVKRLFIVLSHIFCCTPRYWAWSGINEKPRLELLKMGKEAKEKHCSHCTFFHAKQCMIIGNSIVSLSREFYFLFFWYIINTVAIKAIETKNSWQLILSLVGLRVNWAAHGELVKEFTCCNCNKGNLKTTICFKSKMNNWILS